MRPRLFVLLPALYWVACLAPSSPTTGKAGHFQVGKSNPQQSPESMTVDRPFLRLVLAAVEALAVSAAVGSQSATHRLIVPCLSESWRIRSAPRCRSVAQPACVGP